MGTRDQTRPIAAALFSGSRRNVLALLFTRPGTSLYVRELTRAAGPGRGAVLRELRRLEEAGIIKRCVEGRRVYYQANPDCPVYSELARLVRRLATHPYPPGRRANRR